MSSLEAAISSLSSGFNVSSSLGTNIVGSGVNQETTATISSSMTSTSSIFENNSSNAPIIEIDMDDYLEGNNILK